jgi:two-component system response regulator HupR/HoxA
LLETADRLARTDISLVLFGETGTGKEVLARRIHARSHRADGPLVAVNCAAIPETLMESEFFGHVRGAFTGAERSHSGCLQRADGGTLFLDEIGDMSPALQAKLLRVLEDGRVRPVGASEDCSIDVRVLCATHHDLEARVREGCFREDLYFRLAGAALRIPPLRERLEDVRELVKHFLERLNAEFGTDKRAPPSLLANLVSRSWPGNVRELLAHIRLLFHLTDGELLEEPPPVRHPATLHAGPPDHLVACVAPMSQIVKAAIQLALKECHGNREEAARRLGISRSSIYARIQRHGI